MAQTTWSVGIHDKEQHVPYALNRLLRENVVAVGWGRLVPKFQVVKALLSNSPGMAEKTLDRIRDWASGTDGNKTAATVLRYLLHEVMPGDFVAARNGDRIFAVGRFRTPTEGERAKAVQKGAVELPKSGLLFRHNQNDAQEAKHERYENTIGPVIWRRLKRPIAISKRNIALHVIRDDALSARIQSALAKTLADLESDGAPTDFHPNSGGGGRRSTKGLTKEQLKYGVDGEEVVYLLEKATVAAKHGKRLAGKVRWVSKEAQASPYDIESFDGRRRQKWIEVKSTGGTTLDFVISAPELVEAIRRRENHAVVRVTGMAEPPRHVFELVDLVGAILDGDVRLYDASPRLLVRTTNRRVWTQKS